MATLLALNLTHQLTFKKICYYRVISVTEISVPNFRLFYHWHTFTVNLFVLGLFANSVEFIVHSIEKESQKLLGILLSIA